MNFDIEDVDALLCFVASLVVVLINGSVLCLPSSAVNVTLEMAHHGDPATL